MEYKYKLNHTRHGAVHVYDLCAYQISGPLVAMQRDGHAVCDAIVTLVVASDGKAILAQDNDAQDSARRINAEDFGFDPQHPDHPETLKAIEASLRAELSDDAAV